MAKFDELQKNMPTLHEIEDHMDQRAGDPINMARRGGCGDPRSEAPFVAPLNYSEDCVSGNSEYVLVLCERVLQLKITSFLL